MSQRTGAVRADRFLADRRSSEREKMILRVGLLTDAARPGFCLVKNISPTGAQVKLYGHAEVGSDVTFRLGDEDPVAGRIAWVCNGLAGIKFETTVEPALLLRAAQKLAPTKRRSSPRVNTVAQVLLRTGGKSHAAVLCNICTSGVKIRISKPVQFAPSTSIMLPGLPPMKAHVRWTNETQVGLVFDNPLPIELLSHWLDGRLEVSV